MYNLHNYLLRLSLSLDSRDDIQISYLSTRGLMPKSSLGVPQNLYFLDEYTVVVFFLHRVMYV